MSRQSLIFLILIIVVSSGLYFYLNSNKSFSGQLGVNSNSNLELLPQAKISEIVELKNGDSYNITAGFVKKEINGQVVKMLAYNGSIPGPRIKVAKDSEITINFKNETDLSSTIHSHGVRLDNQFDGTPDVTQKAVKPGDMFSYKIKFPDVGAYWYHPHVREDYAQEMGLYGNFIVTPKDAAYWSPVNEEVTLFLDDLLLNNGQIVTFNKSVADHTFMGRFGNTMFINGETNYSKTVKTGEVVRFYIANSANTRVFNFSIPGTKMKLVGGDNGKVSQERFTDSVIIAPSERSIVEVLFEKPGNYQLTHKTPSQTYPLGTITASDQTVEPSYLTEFSALRTNQDTIADIGDVTGFLNKPADKQLKLESNIGGMMGGMMMGGDKIEWEDTMPGMNQNSNANNLKWLLVDQETNKQNNQINWQFKKGDKFKISIFNDPHAAHPMQHPIHIHGQKFLVLSTNGVQNNDLVWKDTALVQKGDTVELLVDMANPGKWLIHCHIPEHMESGMMSQFEVI